MGRTIRVTTRVVVDGPDGSEFWEMERIEDCGNPLFSTRVAWRMMEGNADELRVRMQVPFGEIDEKWRERKPTRDRETGDILDH